MMNEKTEKLIIVGPSGSGKDFLRRALIKKNLRYEPKITTRPIRIHEVDGIDYNFITQKEFESLTKVSIIGLIPSSSLKRPSRMLENALTNFLY